MGDFAVLFHVQSFPLNWQFLIIKKASFREEESVSVIADVLLAAGLAHPAKHLMIALGLVRRLAYNGALQPKS